MGGLDPTKIFLILVIALIVVGPERLPGLSASAGRDVARAEPDAGEVRAGDPCRRTGPRPSEHPDEPVPGDNRLPHRAGLGPGLRRLQHRHGCDGGCQRAGVRRRGGRLEPGQEGLPPRPGRSRTNPIQLAASSRKTGLGLDAQAPFDAVVVMGGFARRRHGIRGRRAEHELSDGRTGQAGEASRQKRATAPEPGRDDARRASRRAPPAPHHLHVRCRRRSRGHLRSLRPDPCRAAGAVLPGGDAHQPPLRVLCHPAPAGLRPASQRVGVRGAPHSACPYRSTSSGGSSPRASRRTRRSTPSRSLSPRPGCSRSAPSWPTSPSPTPCASSWT